MSLNLAQNASLTLEGDVRASAMPEEPKPAHVDPDLALDAEASQLSEQLMSALIHKGVAFEIAVYLSGPHFSTIL